MSDNNVDAIAFQILTSLRSNQTMEGYDLKSLKSDIVLQFGKDLEELDDNTLLVAIKENMPSQNSPRVEIQEFAELSLGNNELGDSSYFLDELSSPNYNQPLSALKAQNLMTNSSLQSEGPEIPKLNFAQLSADPLQQLSPRLLQAPIQSQPSYNGLQDHGPTVITTEEEFLSAFWETSFKIFYNICSTTCLTKDCLCLVGELLSLVEHWNRFRSPAILIAIDVVVQRAMYELSDKFIKKADSSMIDSNTVYTNVDSQKNIEDCISVLSTLAIPLCMKLQNISWNLQYLDPTNSTYAKMHTLNRQLQELLAWTSLAEQAPIPDSFMEMLRFQVQDGVKLTTPRSMAALEIFDNILLSCINEGNNNNLMSLTPQNIEFISNIESKMIFLLKRQLSDEIQVKRCGSNVIGTSFFENGIELDYSVLNVLPAKPLLSGSEQEQNNINGGMNNESFIKELETIVEAELLYESALKHLRACVKDCSVATNEFLNNLLKPTQDNSQQQQQLNSYSSDANARPNMHYIQSLSNSTVLDAEEIRVNGEKFISLHANYRNDRILSQYPILQLVIQKIENYYDEMDREDKSKTSNLRRIIKSLEKVFRENNNNTGGGGNNNPNNNNTFQNVKTITNRLRFIQLKFQSYDPRFRQSIGFTINLDSPLPIQGTELLRNIIKYDSTGKIKLFLNTLKKFVKAHKITDSTNGFLSLFSWYIMGLHVLIKFKYIFYIHGKSFLDSNYSDGNFNEMNLEQKNLQYLCLTQLSRSSLMELLDKFFRYYVEEFDTFKNVISIRHLFHPVNCSPLPLMNKSVWKKNPVLWRLSVEDPCDPIIDRSNSNAPAAFDLGSTLSRPGQLTTFKALRRAVYGMRSILLMGIESAKMNMKKLFSKTELIHLARKSDYMGATIPNPKPWIPKPPSNISSPKDLFKVLPSEILSKLESYDLTIVKRNPSLNDFSSTNDLNSPNGFNVIGNYALPTDRTDFSNRGWGDVTPRQPYSSMNKVASDNSLAGNIISPRIDPLAISNHSVSGGYPLSARLSTDNMMTMNMNMNENEYPMSRGVPQLSSPQQPPQPPTQQQQQSQVISPPLPVPPVSVSNKSNKKGPAIPLLNLGKMPMETTTSAASDMNSANNNGALQGLPATAHTSNLNPSAPNWMGSQSDSSIQFPLNSNRSDAFSMPTMNKFTPRGGGGDMVSPLTTARTVDSGEHEVENNNHRPPQSNTNPLADFDIDMNLPLDSNSIPAPPLVVVPPPNPTTTSSNHSYQQQQQQLQQQQTTTTMPPPGLSMNGLGVGSNSMNMGSWMNHSSSTPQQQQQPMMSSMLSSSQQPNLTTNTLNPTPLSLSSSQYSMNYTPSNPHLHSNLVGISSSSTSSSYGLAGSGNGTSMLMGDFNNNNSNFTAGGGSYSNRSGGYNNNNNNNSGFNSAREPYNNYNNSYNNNMNNRRRKNNYNNNGNQNNITPRMNDFNNLPVGNNNNSQNNDYSNYYSSSASSSFSSRGGIAGGSGGVTGGGMMMDLSDPNILPSNQNNYGQQSHSNPNSARYHQENNNYRASFQSSNNNNMNYLPNTVGGNSNAVPPVVVGGGGSNYLTPRSSQQQQTFQSQYQHQQQLSQLQHHHQHQQQHQQQQQQFYTPYGNNVDGLGISGLSFTNQYGSNNLGSTTTTASSAAVGTTTTSSYLGGLNSFPSPHGPGNVNYSNNPSTSSSSAASSSISHQFPQFQQQQQQPQQQQQQQSLNPSQQFYSQQGWK